MRIVDGKYRIYCVKSASEWYHFEKRVDAEDFAQRHGLRKSDVYIEDYEKDNLDTAVNLLQLSKGAF